MTEPEYVDPSKLRPGPIQHESLPPELLEHVKAVYDVIGTYMDTTLEQFEIGFMRDAHPESEVAVWCSKAACYLTSRFPRVTQLAQGFDGYRPNFLMSIRHCLQQRLKGPRILLPVNLAN